MQRTDWLGWAFTAKHSSEERELNAGEKLVLVYLAAQVGADGMARLDRDQLAKVTDYEPRSLQRILKSLKDTGLLIVTDSGWYGLGAADAANTPPAALLEVTLTRTQVIDQAAPAISQADAEAAGATIAECVTEAADLLMARLNDFGGRLAGRLVELVASLDGVRAAPPPDPVLTTPLYLALVEQGIAEEQAYATAKKLMDQALSNAPAGDGHTRSMRSPEPVRAAAAVGSGAQGVTGGGSQLSTRWPAGSIEERFERVWNVLHGKPPSEEAFGELFAVWEKLEEDENKHSVEGEPSAFELLYPAILKAAGRVRATMTMREFLDPKAIATNRAPWDSGEPGTLPTDGQMATEIATMIEALERANHKQAQAPARVTEKGDDGVTRTENLATYYLRVKRVYQQLQHLQQMGV